MKQPLTVKVFAPASAFVAGMRDERISRREDLLSIDNSRLGCDKGSQQSLDAALPAPEGGVVGL